MQMCNQTGCGLPAGLPSGRANLNPALAAINAVAIGHLLILPHCSKFIRYCSKIHWHGIVKRLKNSYKSADMRTRLRKVND
jgi:hypothetical protein